MARGTVKKSSETLDDILKRINKTSGSNIVSYGIPERDYDRIPFKIEIGRASCRERV